MCLRREDALGEGHGNPLGHGDPPEKSRHLERRRGGGGGGQMHGLPVVSGEEGVA